jgi:hypothetical protein
MKYLIPIDISTEGTTAVNFNPVEAMSSIGFLHSTDEIDAVYFCINNPEVPSVTHKVQACPTRDKLCWSTDVVLNYNELHLVVNGELIKYNWTVKQED